MKVLHSLYLLFLSILLPATAQAHSWQPDILGDEFECRYVNQGTDYSGSVRSTIIRTLSACDSTHRGILYIHGFNDYFFQSAMARYFTDHCLDFYAVDLRRYGRSLRDGDRRFDIRDMSEYFPDIDSALVQMHTDGITDVILMAHSTGGLIASLYMQQPRRDTSISQLILNSPFLDWNQPRIYERILIPMVSCIGKSWPGMTAMGGDSPTYHESMLGPTDSIWGYNLPWKPREWLRINAGWIRAVDRAQHDVSKIGATPIDVPILLMHSDRTGSPKDPPQLRMRSDMVLDVDDIRKYGRRLGPDITDMTVKGGQHDLVRSEPGVRDAVLQAMLNWINSH